MLHTRDKMPMLARVLCLRLLGCSRDLDKMFIPPSSIAPPFRPGSIRSRELQNSRRRTIITNDGKLTGWERRKEGFSFFDIFFFWLLGVHYGVRLRRLTNGCRIVTAVSLLKYLLYNTPRERVVEQGNEASIV